jgi:SAM-dependent methyltransferase
MMPTISKGPLEVKDFYEEAPFPNYNDFESFDDYFKKGLTNPFTLRIARAITENSRVIEIGCGTGQLVNFLSAITPAQYVGFDLTGASLRLADQFAYTNKLPPLFVQGDIFKHPFTLGGFDTVISLGVLHHTVDCSLAISRASNLVSEDGLIIIGLYNSYGRLWTDLRRIFLRSNSDLLNRADHHLRKNLSPSKKNLKSYFHKVMLKMENENIMLQITIP